MVLWSTAGELREGARGRGREREQMREGPREEKGGMEGVKKGAGRKREIQVWKEREREGIEGKG